MRAAGSSSIAPIAHAVGRRGGDGAGAAQDRADARDELAGAERLDDVVVGAELEAQHPVGLVAAGGEHDHRHALVGAQLAQQVEARAVGEHDVEEHEVGALAAGDLEAGGERAGRLRAEALAGEGFRQRNRDRLLVLDEQHHPRLDVHALIVGGLGRCRRRVSRLRRGRGHGRHRRGRCRRRRRGRRCRRSRGRGRRRSRCGSGRAARAGDARSGCPASWRWRPRWRWPARSSRRVAFGAGSGSSRAARVVRVLGLVTRAGDVLGGPGGGDGGRGARRRARQGQRVVGDGQRRGRASDEDRGRGDGEEQEPHG